MRGWGNLSIPDTLHHASSRSLSPAITVESQHVEMLAMGQGQSEQCDPVPKIEAPEFMGQPGVGRLSFPGSGPFLGEEQVVVMPGQEPEEAVSDGLDDRIELSYSGQALFVQ